MLELKQKQKQVVEAVNSGLYHTIVLIGTVGTGKTDVAAHISISIADKFPGTYWPVMRQNLSTARKSVIPSYLHMLDLMNFVEGVDYKYNHSEFVINFLDSSGRVKSQIPFIEADFTKDRDAKKLKGINATGNHIDEADELEETMFITAMSRRGRRNEKGQPAISMITMNPNNSHLKTRYYDPWKAGTLPKGVLVVEFTIEDSWQEQQEIDAMLTNPNPWVQRYIKNNWNYQDDRDSLFKYRYFDAAITSKLSDYINDKRSGGYDVARDQFGDRSVQAQHWGKCAVDIDIFKEKEVEMRTDEQALALIKYDQQNAILAENQAVDAVGIGVGVMDFAASKGVFFIPYKSGAKATDPRFADLRSQVIWYLAQDLENGIAKISEGMPFRNQLISEAMAHQLIISDKLLKVESKDEIKKRIGMSPDIFDAFIMSYYPQLSLDPENDTNRVDW